MSLWLIIWLLPVFRAFTSDDCTSLWRCSFNLSGQLGAPSDGNRNHSHGPPSLQTLSSKSLRRHSDVRGLYLWVSTVKRTVWNAAHVSPSNLKQHAAILDQILPCFILQIYSSRNCVARVCLLLLAWPVRDGQEDLLAQTQQTQPRLLLERPISERKHTETGHLPGTQRARLREENRSGSLAVMLFTNWSETLNSASFLFVVMNCVYKLN